jgi:hypothetical protein
MTQTIEYDHSIGTGSGSFCNEAFVAGLPALCLWAAVGLAVTAAFSVLGFADELTRALAAAG